MHVLDRPHLPRLISFSIAAAMLAIVISLALASSLSNIGRPANGKTVSAHRTDPALTGALHTTAPGRASNPSAGPLSRALPQTWLTARR